MAIDVFYGLHGDEEVVWAETDDGMLFVFEVEVSSSEGDAGWTGEGG